MIKNCKRHGEHDNWKTKLKRNGQVKEYVCRFCRRERDRAIRVGNNYEKILNKYGEELAKKYLIFVGDDKLTIKTVALFLIENGVVRDLQNAKKHKGREGLLKLLCGGEIKCMICGFRHENSSLFDIDHIAPQKDGGEDSNENLQCICPNCHRIKSLNEL